MRWAAILGLGLAIRLIHIDGPVVGMHAWRQADTASIARNLRRNGYDLLHPTVPWGGDGPGWVATEAPIYPLLHALLGASPLSGRLLSIGLGLLAGWLLYRLVRDVLGETPALWSLALYALLPMGAYYTRTIQPDPLILVGNVGGLWMFRRWILTGHRADILAAGLLVCVAGLVKPTALHIGAPMAFLLWHHRPSGARIGRSELLLTLGIFLPIVAWYAWSHHLGATTGLTFFALGPGTDKWGHLALAIDLEFWWNILYDRLGKSYLAAGIAPIVAAGLLLPRPHREAHLFEVWLAGGLLTVALAARGHDLHDYYQLPLLPPLAAIAGRVLGTYLRPRLGLPSLALVIALAMAAWRSIQVYGYLLSTLDPRDHPVLTLAAQARAHTAPDDLVIAVTTNGDPLVFYLADRRGWYVRPHEISAGFFEDRIRRGARYALVLTPVDVPGKDLFDDGQVRLVELPSEP